MFEVNPFFIGAVVLLVGGFATGLYFFLEQSSGGSSPGQSVKQLAKRTLSPTIQVEANSQSIGKDPRWSTTLESIELFQMEAADRESELLAENAALRAEIDRINQQLGGILESSPKVEVPKPKPVPQKKEEPTS